MRGPHGLTDWKIEPYDNAASEQVARWMISNGYATGHGETIEDMLVELEAQAKARGCSLPNGQVDRRAEIIRLMREDFDPTPSNWEGRDWDDNADDVADRIIAVAMAEKPANVSVAWGIVKQWLSDYAAEEAAFSRYRNDALLDGVMTAGTMRALNDALYVQAEADRNSRAIGGNER